MRPRTKHTKNTKNRLILMAPTPIGTPTDIAFGAAVLTVGAAALLVMSSGFGAGMASNGRRRGRDGLGLPGAPSARRARRADGTRPEWPPRKGRGGDGENDGDDDGDGEGED